MKITLKGLKVAKFLSEETLAYSATLLIDGVPVATAENSGKGGMTMLHWTKGEPAISMETSLQINEIVWRSHGFPSSPSYSSDVGIYGALSTAADFLAENIQTNKDMARLSKKGVVFTLPEDKRTAVRTCKWPDGIVTPERVQYALKTNPGAVLWQPMPECFDIPVTTVAMMGLSPKTEGGSR